MCAYECVYCTFCEVRVNEHESICMHIRVRLFVSVFLCLISFIKISGCVITPVMAVNGEMTPVHV